MVNEAKNLVSKKEIISIANLIKKTVSKDVKNSREKVQNYYSVYLRLGVETNKKLHKQNVEAVCKKAGITVKRWANLKSKFNKATELKIDVTKYGSDNSLDDDITAISNGLKKVMNDGTVQTDIAGVSKKQIETEHVNAVNENLLIEVTSNSEFKRFMKTVIGKDWDKAIINKAIAQATKKS